MPTPANIEKAHARHKKLIAAVDHEFATNVSRNQHATIAEIATEAVNMYALNAHRYQDAGDIQMARVMATAAAHIAIKFPTA